MQTKQKWALTLLTALGALSCGQADLVDTYQGFTDATPFDAKFQPNGTTCGSTGRDRCYLPSRGAASGSDFYFHNLGYVAATDKNLAKDSAGRLALPYAAIKGYVYDFPEGCKPGKAYDEREDAYPEDAQWPVFDTLPLTSSTALVMPLVRTQPWTGVASTPCNGIKDAQTLRERKFGGDSGEESLSLRAVVDLTVVPNLAPPSSAPVAPFASGWYRGLQLAYFDGGPVAVAEDTNVVMMDGVWLKPSSTTARPTDATARLVFQARPGEPGYSPVVRLREIAAPATGNPTRLCYTVPCAADSVDVTKPATYTGVLFLVPNVQ